jgi:gamma-glutamyltranspeptidase
MSRVSDAVDRAGPANAARHGSMVAADHPLAVDAAVQCLRDGGSAVEAAVRAALVHPGLDGQAAAVAWDRTHGLEGSKSSSALAACASLAERFGAGMGELLARAPGAARDRLSAVESVTPIEGLYRGHSIFALPEGLAVLEALALLDDWPMADVPADEREHLAIEAIKIAGADSAGLRERLSDAHLDRRRDEIGPRARADLAAPSTESAALHVSVVDADGRCCALVAGTSALLTPAIVFRAGLPWIVLAASGPHDAAAQMLLRAIDLQAAPDEVVHAPRRRWLGGARVRFEERFEPDLVAALERRGHVRADEPADFGAAQLIAIDRDTHTLAGACDPRRDGKIGAA